MFERKIILGSGSPRRKEILSSIWEGEIQVIKSEIEEVYPDDLALEKIPIYLAKLKGEDLKARVNLIDDILITADTIVLCEGRVLGKPIEVEEAKAMLKFLSNKVHQVHTGVAIYYNNQVIEIEEKTDVHFGNLDIEAIDYYIEKYQPLDKAGSYGIQEFIGMIGIKKIDGCFYNVMGLPASKVWEELKKLDF
ncbi:MAG: Maf family nucleotide pyrophosphatase [Chitinophagales bacterium]|jgi:septum formation protein|nr:Maf family nucleotide pyrophosphatase [Sphingobacteriales bacterium]